jgi:hypothetical protein
MREVVVVVVVVYVLKISCQSKCRKEVFDPFPSLVSYPLIRVYIWNRRISLKSEKIFFDQNLILRTTVVGNTTLE